MKDLTDQQLLEKLQQRLQQYQDTYNEVAALKEKLIEVNRKLEEAETMKSHFISNVSNQLINPFASLMGLVKHLKAMGKDDHEKIKEFIDLMYNEMFDLDFQLKNILAAAKLEAGEYAPEIYQVNVFQLFESTLEEFRESIRDKNVRVRYESKNQSGQREDDLFNTDAGKLQLVIKNLLSNAIRFSEEDTTISVFVSLNDRAINFFIKDQGKGVPSAEADKVFDRFYQMERSIHSENKGLGLGLSVTREVIEILGGWILLNTAEGKGVEFVVKIPEAYSWEDVNEVASGNVVYFERKNEFWE